jgi:hypothetical protein
MAPNTVPFLPCILFCLFLIVGAIDD